MTGSSCKTPLARYTQGMADNVTIPVVSPVDISTDEIDFGAGPVHAQDIKLLDGRRGGTDFATIGPDGGIHTGSYWIGSIGALTLPSTARADGEIIGVTDFGVTDLGLGPQWPSGILTSASVVYGPLDPTLTVAAAHVVIVPTPVGTEKADLPVAGDLFSTINQDWLFSAISVESSEFDTSPLIGATAVAKWQAPSNWWQDFRSQIQFGTPADTRLFGFLIADSGGWAEDWSALGGAINLYAKWNFPNLPF